MYASATLAACQSSLPMLRANPSMPCAKANVMSQLQVSKGSRWRCRCTFLPVIKLVRVCVSHHHARRSDNEEKDLAKIQRNYCATTGLVEPVAYAEEWRSLRVISGKNQPRWSNRGNESWCRRLDPCAEVGCRWSAASAARIYKDSDKTTTPGRMV